MIPGAEGSLQQIFKEVKLTDWNWNGSLTHKQNVAKTQTNYRNKVNNYPQSNFHQNNLTPAALQAGHITQVSVCSRRREEGSWTVYKVQR